jgi:arylsulfatase
VPEGVAVNVRGRSYKILADVEIEKADCSGVIFATARASAATL